MRQPPTSRGLALLFALVLAATVALLGAAPAPGPTPQLELKLTSYRVTRGPDGKDVFASGTGAKPGEVVEFRLTATNVGASVLTTARPTIPIPTGMAYAGGSAAPAKAEASLDGKAFAPIPLTRKVKQADGTVRVVAVPASEYRYVRWSLATIAPKLTLQFRVRAKVGD